MSNITDKFREVNSEFLRFDRIEDKLSAHPDLHAFMLLEVIFPNLGGGIISASGHDQIWLGVDPEFIGKLTDDQILELVRCGIRIEDDSLVMFT